VDAVERSTREGHDLQSCRQSRKETVALAAGGNGGCIAIIHHEKQIMTEPSGDVRALVELIAKSLVDAPDEVFVEKFDDDVIELEVAESDVGKVIGRQGRTARALRALLSAAGHRARKRYTLEIIE
jgi:uncharacterized protein